MTTIFEILSNKLFLYLSPGNETRQEQHGSPLRRAVPELLAQRRWRRRLQTEQELQEQLLNVRGPR